MRGDCRPRRTERAEAGRRSQPPQKTQGPSSARNSEPAPLRAPGRFCRPPARPLRSTTHVPCSPGSTTALRPATNEKIFQQFPVQRRGSLRRPAAKVSRRFLPCSSRALRRRSAGNNRLFGAANGNNRLRVTTGKNRLSVAAPEKPGSTSGSAAAPGTASPAQRPLNARMNDRLSARPAPSCPPLFTAWKRLKQPGSSRERGPFLQKAGTVLHLFI